MEQFPGDSSFAARRLPGFAHIAYGQTLSVKDPWGATAFVSAPLDNVPKLSTEGKNAPVAGFRPFWTQPNDAGVVVNVIPGQARNLSFAPSTQIPKANKIFQIVWEMGDDSFNVFGFEEALAGIPFWKPADMWQTIDPAPGFSPDERLVQAVGFPG
jgi:hypothetical protein